MNFPLLLSSLLASLAGYLLGSIPSAIWIAKYFYSTDILAVGSKNPGMTNVLRTLGWKPAIPVTLLDAGKGYLACYLAFYWTHNSQVALAAGVCAIIGHSFTCFARFKGGKGVLTTLGIFIYLVPITSLVIFAVWGSVVWLTRYVSLGSVLAALVLPISVYTEYRFSPDRHLLSVFYVALGICFFVVYRHRSNLSRLRMGTENKLGMKR